MMVDQREAALSFIKINGPVLPVQIAKVLNTNILFSSAILSELVDRKLIKITHASIGGSPVYYLSGQEALMDEKLYHSLGGKEKEAYYLIKDKKIVREKDLEPWQRVAIKSLKDFTRQITVLIDNEQDSFWKHHLVSDEEAKVLIEDYIKTNLQKNIIATNKIYVPEEVISQEIIPQNIIQNSIIPEQLVSKIVEENIIEKDYNKIYNESINERQEIVKEVIKSIKEDFKSQDIKREIIAEESKKPEGKFYNNVSRFLEKNNIEILKEELVKKDKVINFIVDIKSSLGKLRYLAVAKSKPTINEADVSMAYAEGQIKKLPVIFLIDGKINKKVEKLIETKFKGQVLIKEL